MVDRRVNFWKVAVAMGLLPLLTTLACGAGTVTQEIPTVTPAPTNPPATAVPTNTLVPTNTPEPTSTPVPTALHLEDPLDDGLNCTTGEFLDFPTPLDVDITMVHAEFLPDIFHVDIEIGQVDALANPLFGGVEFLDSTTANSELDPNWFFNGRGNKNFSFQYSPPSFIPQLHVFDPTQGGWYTATDTAFTGMVDGNHILFDIPIGEVPPDSPFYISITNFSACDAVGLSPDGVPELFIPFPGDGAP